MNAFPRNRYDASEFVRGFDTAPILRDAKELRISFSISKPEAKDEMEIYFPGCTADPPPTLLELARQVCLRIVELDNLVQDSCEEEWRRTDGRIDIDAYDLYLAYIQIETDVVGLEYYGTKVNTQWTAKFKPGSWTKLNF